MNEEKGKAECGQQDSKTESEEGTDCTRDLVLSNSDVKEEKTEDVNSSGGRNYETSSSVESSKRYLTYEIGSKSKTRPLSQLIYFERPSCL